MKPLIIKRDPNLANTFARPAPDSIYAAVLTAATNKAITVPAGATFVIFSADGNFYARPTSTAATPTVDVTDGTASELNPTIWDITDIATINLISATAGRVITMAFYKAVN